MVAHFFCVSMYVFNRTVERSSYERQGSGAWMSPSLGRGYGGNDRSVGYSRQGSGNGVRTYEDKASFFPNPANIGRNYDEDERKPMDGQPRSGNNDRYEDHGYEERPRSGYEKIVDRYSMDEQQGSYTPSSGSDRFGHPAEGVNYGPGDGQVMTARSLLKTDPVHVELMSQVGVRLSPSCMMSVAAQIIQVGIRPKPAK